MHYTKIGILKFDLFLIPFLYQVLKSDKLHTS